MTARKTTDADETKAPVVDAPEVIAEPAADANEGIVAPYRSAAGEYAAAVSGACGKVAVAVEELRVLRGVLNDLAPGYDEARVHLHVTRLDQALVDLVAATAPVRGIASDLATA